MVSATWMILDHAASRFASISDFAKDVPSSSLRAPPQPPNLPTHFPNWIEYVLSCCGSMALEYLRIGEERVNSAVIVNHKLHCRNGILCRTKDFEIQYERSSSGL